MIINKNQILIFKFTTLELLHVIDKVETHDKFALSCNTSPVIVATVDKEKRDKINIVKCKMS